MHKPKLKTRFFDLPNLVLAVTILSGLVTFFAFGAELPAQTKVWVLALTLGYLLIAFFGYDWCQRQNRLWLRVVYFVVELALFSVILFVARIGGGIWLIVFPLVSQASQQPRAWVTLVFASVVLIFFGCLLLLGQPLGQALIILFQFVGGLGFVFVFTRIASNENKARLEMEGLAAQLREANQKLGEYAAQAEELAITRERNRVAREIHDSLGHYLTVVNVQIEAARVLLESNPAQAKDALSKAQSLTKNGLTEIRRSVAALRASPLDGKSLVEGIRGLADDNRATGIATGFAMKGNPHPLEMQTEMTLYRAVQEALTNVRKHAKGATQVNVTLDYASDHVRLCVQDNGINELKRINGLNATGFGLLGLRERMQLLGGELQTHISDDGYTLEIKTPVTITNN